MSALPVSWDNRRTGFVRWGLWMIWICGALWSAASLAANPPAGPTRANDDSVAVERPIYLDVVPVAGAPEHTLPPDVVIAMARESLAGVHQAVIPVDGQHLPSGVRVLRIMYIVHEQTDATGTTLAASASTALLRTAADAAGHELIYSNYSGLQQTLVQGPDAAKAQADLRSHFKQELQSRIASAFSDKPVAAS